MPVSGISCGRVGAVDIIVSLSSLDNAFEKSTYDSLFLSNNSRWTQTFIGQDSYFHLFIIAKTKTTCWSITIFTSTVLNMTPHYLVKYQPTCCCEDNS